MVTLDFQDGGRRHFCMKNSLNFHWFLSRLALYYTIFYFYWSVNISRSQKCLVRRFVLYIWRRIFPQFREVNVQLFCSLCLICWWRDASAWAGARSSGARGQPGHGRLMQGVKFSADFRGIFVPLEFSVNLGRNLKGRGGGNSVTVLKSIVLDLLEWFTHQNLLNFMRKCLKMFPKL